MLARAMVRNSGGAIPASAGIRSLAQKIVTAITGDNATITVAGIINGIINRTGTTANTTDVFPSADALVAAMPDLTMGDSFEFQIRMANAHTNTLTLGTGITSAGTVGIVASNIRKYLLTLLSGNTRAQTIAGSTTNASAVLTNLPARAAAGLSVGMGVTGTNIPASSYIIAINVTANTVTINANATGTGDLIAFSFFPRFELFGVSTAAI